MNVCYDILLTSFFLFSWVRVQFEAPRPKTFAQREREKKEKERERGAGARVNQRQLPWLTTSVKCWTTGSPQTLEGGANFLSLFQVPLTATIFMSISFIQLQVSKGTPFMLLSVYLCIDNRQSWFIHCHTCTFVALILLLYEKLLVIILFL